MSDLPETPTTESPADPSAPDDDGGAALESSADAIQEAREAEGTVAAADDITSEDDDRAGEHSLDPDGQGGQP
jgi:hypothetical protein